MTRRFSSAPVDPEDVVALLDLARRAPSAGFSQGTHFLVLAGDDLAAFWRETGAGAWFEKVQPGVLAAPVVVLPLADPHAYSDRYAEGDKAGRGLDDLDRWEVPFWLTDTAMAVQNLLLLLESERLGALYFGAFRNVRPFLDARGVPPQVRHVGAVAIGHRDTEDQASGSPGQRPRRERTAVVHVGSW